MRVWEVESMPRMIKNFKIDIFFYHFLLLVKHGVSAVKFADICLIWKFCNLYVRNSGSQTRSLHEQTTLSS